MTEISVSELTDGIPHQSAPTAWRCTRLAGSVLLLMAATAKLFSARHGVPAGSLLEGSFDAILAALEAFLACWLASGAFAFGAWAAAVSAFWCFFVVSAYQAINGSASCGCFGDLTVDPVYTALLDAGVLLSLCRYSPTEPAITKGRISSRSALCACIVVGVVVFFVGGTGAITHIRSLARGPTEQPPLFGDLTQYVGANLPFLNRLSASDRIRTAKCLLVLVRPECPKCQDVIAASRQRGGRCVVDGARLPIVLVQVTSDERAPPLAPESATLTDVLRVPIQESGLLPVPCGFLLDKARVVRFVDTQSIGRTFALVR